MRLLPLLVACTWTACATATTSKPTTLPLRTSQLAPGTRIRWVGDFAGEALDPSRIGRADLEQARTLLSQARNELKPAQSELLSEKLEEAQRAFDRFNEVASKSGKVAEVPRGARDFEVAERAGKSPEGLEASTRAGPLLALLILLWPSPTAGPEEDHAPEWLGPQRDFEAKLRELAQASEQVRSEIEATRRQPARDASAQRSAKAPKGAQANAPQSQAGGSQPPGKPPCDVIGTGGRGSSRPPGAPRSPITCEYNCNGEYVKLTDVWGLSSADCSDPTVMRRAAERAAEQVAARRGKER